MSGMQQLNEQYSQLASEIEELNTLVETVEEQRQGCEDAIEAINNIEEGDEILVPLGGDTFVPAKVESLDEVLVGIGADVSAEVGPEKAIEELEDKSEELQEQKQNAEEQIEQKSQEIQQIQQQAQMMQAQQQQQAQQQGGDEGQE